MATLQQIPLSPKIADQIFSIVLDDTPYNLRVLWNERFQYFALSINTADNEPILTNIKMVYNYPLTDRFRNILLPFGVFYFLKEGVSNDISPFDGLGITYNLYYYEPDIEVAAQPITGLFVEPTVGTIWDSGFTTWDANSTLWDQ